MGGNISHIFQFFPVLIPPPLDLSKPPGTSSGESYMDPSPNPGALCHSPSSAPPPRPSTYFQQPAVQSLPSLNVAFSSHLSHQHQFPAFLLPGRHRSNQVTSQSVPPQRSIHFFPGPAASIDPPQSSPQDQQFPQASLCYQPAQPPSYQSGSCQTPDQSLQNPDIIDLLHYSPELFPSLSPSSLAEQASIDSLQSSQQGQFPQASLPPVPPQSYQAGPSQPPSQSFLNPDVIDPSQSSQQFHSLDPSEESHHRQAQYYSPILPLISHHRQAQYANAPPQHPQPSFSQQFMPRLRQLPTPPTHTLPQNAVASCSQVSTPRNVIPRLPIRVSLMASRTWVECAKIGCNEIIIDRDGKGVYPPLEFQLENLHESKYYRTRLAFRLASKKVWKYNTSGDHWDEDSIDVDEDELTADISYKSPYQASGEVLMIQPLLYDTISLSSRPIARDLAFPRKSYITLKPYRKYQPVFEIIEETKCMGTMIPGRELEVNKFVFEETQFMTVKSIMNKKVNDFKSFHTDHTTGKLLGPLAMTDHKRTINPSERCVVANRDSATSKVDDDNMNPCKASKGLDDYSKDAATSKQSDDVRSSKKQKLQ